MRLPHRLLAGLAAALLPLPALAQPALLPTTPVPAMPAGQVAQLAAAPMAAGPLRPGAALAVEAGSGRIVSLRAPAVTVFAADPKVAEVRPASATSLFVFGVGPGRTTIAAMDAAGHPIAQYEVTVRPSAFGASEAQSALARLMPGRDLRVETRPGGLVLRGEVATAADADQAVAIARGYLPEGQTVDNRLGVLGSAQVNLQVRIAEVSREVTRQFGVDWQALGSIGRFAVAAATTNALADITNLPSAIAAGYRGAVNLDAVLTALAQDRLVNVLAEPNLTAISGETASFLVGGEFPVPVASNLAGQVTVQFKQFGISLAFVPTVMSAGRISLRVRPEVSELTEQGAIRLSAGNATLQIPALSVRRAETTVELGSGQSFAIAGLLQDSSRTTGRALPGIGEVPVLGALFRSDAFQRNETELVILITPYLVKPNGDPGALRTPNAGLAPPSDAERILQFRQFARRGGTPPRIPGDAGFVIR